MLISDGSSDVCSSDLAGFGSKIGYPDKWRDWSGLRTSRDSYLGNVLAAREFNYKWYLSMIGKPMDRSLWLMTPQTVNAYYWPNQNEIVFSAAILQPPGFDPAADDALNYGAIGSVIGHEMRSEEHTSELQSLMRISYAVFCLQKKNKPLQ